MTACFALEALLAQNIPDLPGALCKDRPATFDIEDGHLQRREVRAAVNQCLCCSALELCAAWAGQPAPQRASIRRGRRAARSSACALKPSTVQPKVKPKPPSPVDRAADWLTCYLTARSPAASAVVKLDAAATGVNKHPLHAARARLRVTVDHVGKETCWSLPGGQAPAIMKDVLYQSA